MNELLSSWPTKFINSVAYDLAYWKTSETTNAAGMVSVQLRWSRSAAQFDQRHGQRHENEFGEHRE
jgi:hypothetical protein